MSLQQIPGHYIVSASATATGGGSTLYNTAITATSTASATGAYTATQIPVSSKDNVTASPTGTTSQFEQWSKSFYAQMFDWSSVSSLDILFVDIPMNYDVGPYKAFVGIGTDFDQATSYGHVSNGYLAVQTGTYDTGVSAVLSRYVWDGLESYHPSTVYVGFGSYEMQQEYTGVMDTYFTGQTTTGTSYPYPDRPVTTYFSALAYATANECISSIAGNYSAKVNGSATNGTKTVVIESNCVGGSVSALQPALSDVLGTGMFNNYYPTSAYSITRSTGSVTSGSTGLGL